MAMPDIVNLLNQTLSSVTTAQKLAMLNDFCAARGYQETIAGEPNPETKKAFMNKDINVNYIKKIIDSHREDKAIALITYEPFEVG